MNASFLPRLRLFGIASVLILAAPAAMAQSGPESQPSDAAAAKSSEKTGSAAKHESASKSGDKEGSASKKPKLAAHSGYATEAEARAHCHGGVVWVGEDHFSHYPGSREYGRKPGAFACE